MLRKVLCSAYIVSVLTSLWATDATKTDASVSPDLRDGSYMDFFFNVKASHERKNEHFWGPKNCSAFAFNPVITIADFTLEADYYYGRQFKNIGYLKSPKNLSKITGYSNLADFYDLFENEDKILQTSFINSMTSNVDKAHFYRSYARLLYINKAHNFRVVLGDTATRNTVGFQSAFSGGGIGIFRQSGDGSVISAGSPIVITRLSKVECKLGDEIVGLFILPPGTYSIDNLPEEAKMAGVTLKISDQIGRKEKLKIDYFGSYELLDDGADDFDVTIVFPHRWDIDDPHHIRYRNRPVFSGNYRYGYSKDVTIGGGIQAKRKTYLLDLISIFNTKLGRIAPNIAFSDTSYDAEDGLTVKKRKAVGAGIFYSIPENDYGLMLETFFSVKSKGFSDLGFSMDSQKEYNKYMEKYFTEAAGLTDAKDKLLNTFSEESTRQVVARLYSKPICGITPSFIFNGVWSKSEKLREYTLSFSFVAMKCTFTLSGGLTYDAPSGGRNRKSPDRRFLLACSIPLNKELSVGSTYSTYDGKRDLAHLSLTYEPEAVEGLKLSAERYKGPGSDNPSFSAEYENKYFGLKVEEDLNNGHRNSTTRTHDNQQRFYFGTSLSPRGFSPHKEGGFNTLKTAKIEVIKKK